MTPAKLSLHLKALPLDQLIDELERRVTEAECIPNFLDRFTVRSKDILANRFPKPPKSPKSPSNYDWTEEPPIPESPELPPYSSKENPF